MKAKKGFTLVELAIVLVIIGLLIGGILKGRQMITNAKIKRVKSDIDGIVSAVFSYQDKYGYLPGDDPQDRFNLGATGNGNGIIDTNEQVLVWRDLIAAGLVAGDSSKTNETEVAKRHPFGGMYVFRYDGALGKNYIFVDNIPSDIAKSLDEKYDDGKYNTGDIRANANYTSGLRDMRWYVL